MIFTSKTLAVFNNTHSSIKNDCSYQCQCIYIFHIINLNLTKIHHIYVYLISPTQFLVLAAIVSVGLSSRPLPWVHQLCDIIHRAARPRISRNQGWGVLIQFPPSSYFLHFWGSCVGVTWSFLLKHYFHHFRKYKKTGYLLNIMFIFDRWHLSNMNMV